MLLSFPRSEKKIILFPSRVQPVRKSHRQGVSQKHLRNLAGVRAEVQLEVQVPVTVSSVLNALEARYPMLAGTIRDHQTHQRRPFVRFYACGEDFSLESPDTPLPDKVAAGEEPFFVIGAIAGG
jgi:sulfur-carrier protein